MRLTVEAWRLAFFVVALGIGSGLSAQDLSREVSSASSSGAAWIAWEVPTFPDRSICCWEKGRGCCEACSLDGSRGFSFNDDVAGSGRMIVVVRADRGAIRQVRLFDAACGLRAGDEKVHWVRDVDPARSIAWLASQIDGTVERESGILAAIAMHDHAAVQPLLQRLAGDRNRGEKVREQVLFWIGQTGGEPGFRFLREFLRGREPVEVRKRAVFALSQSSSEQAVPALIALARNDEEPAIRREAIFWLGQKAGAKAAGELRRVVDEDPDDEVREHAVFAISQLPRERAIPLLSDLVRNHESPRVRERAMFWLAQTGDARALALIEEILAER